MSLDLINATENIFKKRFFYYCAIFYFIFLSSFVQAVCIGIGCVCSVTNSVLNFGQYNPQNTNPLQSTALIQISCTASSLNAHIGYTVTLSPGLSGSYAARQMTTGNGSILNYNVFLDSSLTTVWGNGTAGTQTVSGNDVILQLISPYQNSYTAYGVISPQQNVKVGNYIDSIIITVNF